MPPSPRAGPIRPAPRRAAATWPRRRSGSAGWSSLLPDEPEALGLLALMLYVEARRAARRDASGEYVPLAEQDTALWDDAPDRRGRGAAVRASALGAIGRYQLEAAMQSAHVVRRRSGEPTGRRSSGSTTGSARSPARRWSRSTGRSRWPRRAAPPLDWRPCRAVGRRLAPGRISAVLGGARRTAVAPRRAARRRCEAYERAIGLEADPAVRRFLQQKLARMAARQA